MGSTIQSERFLHVAADLCLQTLMGSLQGGVLGAQAEVQALHKPLALNVSGQEVEPRGQLVGHEIEVTWLVEGKRAHHDYCTAEAASMQ